MIRATQVRGQHHWSEPAADTVVLDFDDRHRRRMAMVGTSGLEFLLDLESAISLRGGDALLLEDGRLVEVVASAEPLLEVRAADPQQLARLAWHLGNRHLPMQIAGRGLRIRRDHVIEAMLKGLGARVVEIEAPFDPEGGAYAPATTAHHDHHDHHDHAHHDHAAHARAATPVAHDHAAAGHVHDEHCGHDHHGHSHSHDHT